MNIKTNVFYLLICFFFLSACKEKSEGKEPGGASSENTIMLPDSSVVQINTDSKLANDGLLLQFTPEQGKKYNMTVDMNYDMTTSAMGQELKQKMFMSMGTDMTVTQKDPEGNVTLSTQYKNVKMNMDMGFMKMEYESGKEPTDEMSKMMAKVFDPFLTTPLTITMDKSAKVKSVDGFDEISKKITDAVGAEGAANFDQMNNMQESIQGSFAYLPDKEVKIGDTWQQEMQTNFQQYPIKMKSTFTLIDRKDGIASIAVQSTMSMDQTKMSKEEMQKLGFEEMTMNGTTGGTMQVDEKTGWTTSGDIKQNIKMEITAQGQKVPVAMIGTMKMRSE